MKQPGHNRITKRVGDAAFDMNAGDLLLFRGESKLLAPSTWFTFLIQRSGRSPYSHVGTAVAIYGEFYNAQTVEGIGGTISLLATEVAKWPGTIDVFRPNADGAVQNYDPNEVAKYACRQAGKPYGYAAILRSAALHLPFLRLVYKAPIEDSPSDRPPFCSSLRAMAEKHAGYDPVPNLGVHATEPGDLGRSSFYTYLFTLVP